MQDIKLLGRIDAKIHFSCLDRAVSQPERYLSDIPCRFQDMHSAGVAHDMRRDRLRR